MIRILVALAVLGLFACGPKPVKVRVSCDRTGIFEFTMPLDGEYAKIKTPPCDAKCSSCGQECSVQVIE